MYSKIINFIEIKIALLKNKFKIFCGLWFFAAKHSPYTVNL